MSLADIVVEDVRIVTRLRVVAGDHVEQGVEAVLDERLDGVPGRVKGSSPGATPALGGQTRYQ